MSKVLLINTSFREEEIKAFTKLSPPLGLLTIAAPLIRNKFEVCLIDPQIDEDYIQRIKREIEQRPLFVGMTTFMGTNILNTMRISRKIREINKHIPIIWGGPMATLSPEMCLQTGLVDYIAMGMGDKTVVEIASALEQKKDVSNLQHVSMMGVGGKPILKDTYFLNEDLDMLDFPQLQLWDQGIKIQKLIPILSSRGCPRNCAYCINNIFTGRKKWFCRSSQNVLDEMIYWNDVFKIDKFNFIDDNFLVNTKRACAIIKESRKRKFRIAKISGHLHDYKYEILNLISDYVDNVGFSIESASLRIQKLINKVLDLEKAISLMEYFTENKFTSIATNFMFGFPTETDEDIAANIIMACRIREINKNIRMVPFIYTPQPKDDILLRFPMIKDKIQFSVENLSKVDFAPNRSRYLSPELHPWMDSEEINFYLNFILVWFYHFDFVVRDSQRIDVEGIYRENKRIANLFKTVPLPS